MARCSRVIYNMGLSTVWEILGNKLWYTFSGTMWHKDRYTIVYHHRICSWCWNQANHDLYHFVSWDSKYVKIWTVWYQIYLKILQHNASSNMFVVFLPTIFSNNLKTFVGFSESLRKLSRTSALTLSKLIRKLCRNNKQSL